MTDINKFSEEKQLKAIKRNPFDIIFIDNPSEQVQLEAVRKKEICYIINPSKIITKHAIEYIKFPTTQVQLEAVKQFPGILDDPYKWIKNPCQEVLDMAMIKDIIE